MKNCIVLRCDFMSNYVMNIDFFGSLVRAESENNMVSLTDIFTAGNRWRANNEMSFLQINAFKKSVALEEYLEAASIEWGIPKEKMIYAVGKGNKARTMAHISVAMLAAEHISPAFHARVHRIFIEGKILEFRDFGGTEFKNLNGAIDLYLPGREGRDNKGVYIQIAKSMREKIMGKDAEAGCWDTANVGQIHKRYEMESLLVNMLRLGVVKDFEHLKELIARQ